jgi:hypothetical protein
MLISFLIIMFLFLFLFQLYSYFFNYYEGLTNSSCELQTLIDIATKQQQLESSISSCNITALENSLNEVISKVEILWQQSNAQQTSLNSQAASAPNYSTAAYSD